ncbi:cache domain-containing sensor histidine kinase [Paenibacillus flagellatus]|uniref:Two-component sensor histidine kinase n=1 Tax=Paenibacillus flagellatus TaxID=2211139 RepID=A0A2V5K7P5_9BACL|nr:sensor histidine kinase [Paenibacillus flagellatus]PYI55475.1 two-component sensor histidine kinase [Paenibacillus flagellatus]
MRFFSLKWKSTAIFILLVTLPTLMVGNFVLSEYDRILRRQFADSMDKNLNTVEMNLSEKIKTVEDISDYMIYKDIFREFMTTPQSPETLKRIGDIKKEIEGFVTFQLMSKKDIKSISIRGFGGNVYDLGEPVAGEEGRWTNEANGRKGAPVWSDAYPIHSGWSGDKRVLSMFRVINSYDDGYTPLGMVTIRLDEADIAHLLEVAVPPELGTAFLLRKDGRVLLDRDAANVGRPYPDAGLTERLGSAANAPFRYESGGESYLVFARSMKATGWSVVAMIPEGSIVGQTQHVKSTLRTLLIVMLLLGLIALVGFEFAIIRPILELRKETHRLKKGDFTARVEVRSRDEIGELGRQFNHMVQTIKELIDNKYKLEIRQRESELKMLQQQMAPHFLYNTLDMIRWTARLEKAMETSRMIELLSRFFRTGLDRASTWTSLEHELEFVRSYLDLQQKRLGDKLTYTIYMEASLEAAVVLKKIVQPLVENSVKHGFTPRRGGSVNVRCFREGNDLRIEVYDSGSGFAPETVDRLRHMFATGKAADDLLGHALCNIHERLSIVYGQGYGVTLIENRGAGAGVRLTMPLTFPLPSGGTPEEERVS